MKSKLKLSAGILLVFGASLLFSLAQGPGMPAAPMGFDPATGMPIATPAPASQWRDDNWKDPEITLTNVLFDDLRLSDVAKLLIDQFKQQFDVLLPGNPSSAVAVNGQLMSTSWGSDWRSEQITLRLKNVSASEIFAAMNLLFENNRTPLRWELKLNGHRQIALLRVLVDPTPQGIQPGAPEVQRRVYFVGDLVGDEKNHGMTMEQIIKTVTDVWGMANVSGGTIQFHKDAQLLVVSGSPGEIGFMEQTLNALKEKTEWERFKSASKSAEAKVKTNESKPAPSGN